MHVMQRGNNRGPIFADDQDREVFLTYLRKGTATRGVAVHAFALMGTHYHLLATPESAEALPRAVQHFGGRYVQYFNRRHARTGTLWDGRYRAKLLDDERYLFTCLRYIEYNPVSAGIVKSPEAYRWSSYRVHGCGSFCPWLVPHRLYVSLGATGQERQAAYRAICEGYSAGQE
jgi:putative transposase